MAELLGHGDGLCLDYGCGVGHQLPMIESLGWTVMGFDLSQDMLRRAALRCERLAVANASAFPFADGQLDAVTTSLTHIERVVESGPLPTPVWLGIVATRMP